MKRRVLLFGTAAVLAGTTAAWALKMEVNLMPRSLTANGFKIKAHRDDDNVNFVIERDLKKSIWPGRSGHLSLPGDDGKSKNKRFKPTEKDGIQTYRFTVPADLVSVATFPVTEVQTAANDPDGEELVGGGTYYRFRLADYTRSR